MFYKIAVLIARIVLFPFYRIRVHGLDKLNKDEPVIVCANHWSNLDPFFLAIALPLRLNFMAKKELFEIPILKNLLKAAGVFPVDRHKNNMKTLRYSVNLIKDGNNLGIFPEGTRVKAIDRSNLKEGVGFIGLRSKADIVPVEILASYRLFSRVDIFVNEPIAMKKYSNLKSKEAMVKISDEIYEDIYENRKKLESR